MARYFPSRYVQPISLFATVSVVCLLPSASPGLSGIQSPQLVIPSSAQNNVIRAQAEEGQGYGSGGPQISRNPPPTASSPMNSPIAVTRALDAATKFCRNLASDEYTIDCLAYEYFEIQRGLPDVGEMAKVKKVLADTSKQLRELARSNKSTTKPPIRVSKGGEKFDRALIPVATPKLPQLSREAARIVNNGATLIIRASGDSNRKRAQYQQIAKSMQTGAILLRSL